MFFFFYLPANLSVERPAMEPRETFWELHRKLADCYAHDVAEHRPSIQSDRRNSLQRRLSLQSVQKEASLVSAYDESQRSPANRPARMVSFDRNSTVKVIDFDEAEALSACCLTARALQS